MTYKIKNQVRPYTTIFFISFVGLLIVHFSSCSDERCEGDNEKVLIEYKEIYVPYNENEKLLFLHNKADTHIMQVIQKQIYYVTESAYDDKCAIDHESAMVSLLNLTTNDPLVFNYVYDRHAFQQDALGTANDYTYYKLSYKNKLFMHRVALDQSYINNVFYTGLHFIGSDTVNNFMALKMQKGIMKIVVDGEMWEIIP